MYFVFNKTLNTVLNQELRIRFKQIINQIFSYIIKLFKVWNNNII